MQCDLCGCRGIHACIGSKQKPWTEDDHVKFKEAMKIVKQLRSKRL